MPMIENFLWLSHYLLIVPFSPHDITTKEGLHTRGRVLRKRLFLGIQTCTITFAGLWATQTTNGIKGSGSDHEAPPVKAVVMRMLYICWIAFGLTVVYTVWMRRQHLQDLLNRLSTVQGKESGRLFTVVIGYVILVLLILPAEEVFIVCYRVHQYEPYDFYIAIAEQMRDMISNAFATSNVHTGTIADDPNLNVYGFLALVCVACVFHLSLITYFGGCLCFVIATIFYGAVKTSAGKIRTSKNQKQKLELANDLIELSSAWKKAVGGLTFFYCFSFLPFYSFKIQESLKGDWEIIVQVTFGAASFLWFLFIAAETNSQVHTGLFVVSMTENGSLDRGLRSGSTLEEREKEVAILHQISNNEIGLKGITFTITYSFVGSIVGSIITYCIVILQFQQGCTQEIKPRMFT